MKKFYFINLVIFLIASIAYCQEFEFQTLGILNNTGSDAFSNALDVSSDGLVVTGITKSQYEGETAGEAYRWENGIMTGIGFYNPYTSPAAMSFGTAISADGTFITGYTRTMDSQGMWETFLWMQGEGMTGLGGLSGPPYRSEGRGISADGSVVIGRDFDSFRGFRWANGEMEELSDGDNYFWEAWGVSADGSVVAGVGEINGVPNQAGIWKLEEGIIGLGTPVGENSISLSVSADGFTVVGSRSGSNGGEEDIYREAFKWTEEMGMVGLGYLDNSILTSEAKDVSDNGSVVVGYSDTDDGFRAFIWTEETGMLSIQEILENNGIDLTGWKISMANAISADGKIIVGDAINPEGQFEAWRAVLPFVPTEGECAAPDTFFAGEITDTSVQFSWEPSPNEVNGYLWQVLDLGGTPGEDEPLTSGTTEPGMTSAFAMGLNPGTSYNVYIQTICTEGELSNYGGPFMITTTGGGGECTPPSDITVSTVTNSVAFVSWTENGDATEWELEYGESGFTQGEGTIVIDNDGIPGETIGGLTQGVEYDVYVRAVCEFSESDWEGPVVFVIEPEPCGAPSDIVVDNVTPIMVYVNWTENGEATEWEIEYGESGFTQGEGTIILDNDGTPGEAISGLQAETDYDAYVRSICEFSESEWMGPTPFTTEEDLGTTENTIDGLVLYPNPTTGILNVKTEEPITQAEVYTINGSKLPVQLSETGHTIDISDLSTGIYFVRITANNHSQTYKVIKE